MCVGTNQSGVEIDLPRLGGKRVWRSYLMPQRIDVANGKVYGFGAPRGIRQNQFYGFPKNHPVAFAWNGSEFLRVTFLQLPSLIRQEENVYACVPASSADYQALAKFYAELDGVAAMTD